MPNHRFISPAGTVLPGVKTLFHGKNTPLVHLVSLTIRTRERSFPINPQRGPGIPQYGFVRGFS
jgi:hypothetical protein